MKKVQGGKFFSSPLYILMKITRCTKNESLKNLVGVLLMLCELILIILNFEFFGWLLKSNLYIDKINNIIIIKNKKKCKILICFLLVYVFGKWPLLVVVVAFMYFMGVCLLINFCIYW